MKKTAIIIATFLISNFVFAQMGIQTVPVLKQKTNFNFTEEWQYLSSDIYLMNPAKFNDLVNDLAFGLDKDMGKKKKKKDDDYIEYLLITAKVNDLKFLGGDLIYPIYNFQFKQAEDNSYQSNINQSIEVIRILDNLPLVSNKDYIEAEIKGEAITNLKQDRINMIISESLKSISKLSNPSQAIMELVGEYGKVMDSKIQKTQYQFSTTIRLYEDQDFDKQLHSINVFVFDINSSKPANFKTEALTEYILSSSNPAISKDILQEKLKYSKYPYMVIVNYKSKYISEPVIGDEVDSESIEIRIQKTKTAYEKGLINKETYTQEMVLIEFLKAFIDLKMSINNYKLNYKNAVTKDFSKSFFLILQNYRNLKNILSKRDKEYETNNLYKNEFRKYYENILTNAELYLDENNYLKNIKGLVNTLFEYENLKKEPTIAQREQYLRSLYSVELPVDEENSIEVKAIKSLTKRLEDDIYSTEYRTLILSLEKSAPDTLGLAKVEILKNKMNSSYCKWCKESANKAIVDFDERYQKTLMKDSYRETDAIKQKAKDLVFALLIKEECIDKNLKEQFPVAEDKPSYILLFEEEYSILKTEREEMFQLTRTSHEFKNMQELKKFNNKLEYQIIDLDSRYKSLCEKVKKLCSCEN